MQVVDIELNLIKSGEFSSRIVIEDEAFGELCASIRRLGVLVPIVVKKVGDGYVVVAGHRRLVAARHVGLEVLPAKILDGEGSLAREINFAENFFRKDLSPIEQACAIADVVRSEEYSLQAVAAMLHRSVHWVSQQISLTNWPDEVQVAVHTGQLSVSAASNLAVVTDDSYRHFLVKQATESGASARTTAAWLQAWRSMQPAEAAVLAEPVAGSGAIVPAVPQAPCICCGEVYRTDELSHVPACSHCIQIIREVGMSRNR